MLGRLAGIIANAATVEMGLPVALAYSLEQQVSLDLAEVAEKELARVGYAPFSESECILELLRRDDEVDWPDVASRAGQTYDEEACFAYASQMPRL